MLEICVEMHLVFDNDYNVYEITKKLQIVPFECKNKNETRINPITNQHNPGYWTFKISVYDEYDLDVALNNMLEYIGEKKDIIKEICDFGFGEVFFDIVPKFSPQKIPSLCFNKKFLQLVNYLNAEIRIDMYVEEP